MGEEEPDNNPRACSVSRASPVLDSLLGNRGHCVPGKPTGTFQITGQYISLQPTWRLGQTHHLTWLLPPWLFHSVAILLFPNEWNGIFFRKWRNNFSNWKHFLFYSWWVPKSEKNSQETSKTSQIKLNGYYGPHLQKRKWAESLDVKIGRPCGDHPVPLLILLR